MLGILGGRVSGLQALVVAYTDNPSGEVNDLRRDHPHLEYVIKGSAPQSQDCF